MNEFRLVVDLLTEAPERHVFEAGAEWWAERDVEERDELCIVETPFQFVLEASRVREEVVLEGELASGQVTLECSRCGKRYSHVLRDSFRLVLLATKSRRQTRSGAIGSEAKNTLASDPDEERGLAENGLLLGEDLGEGWFRGPVIQLDDFFGEMIALAMPLQPLCDSECQGICSHCGVDLSETTCDCVDEKIDSPFAVLAKLKGGDN